MGSDIVPTQIHAAAVSPIAIGFIVFFVLLALAMVLVVRNAAARAKRGRQQADERGWQHHPESLDFVAGWDGWPFLAGLERLADKARVTDVMTGHHHGADFLSLRYSHHESGGGDARSEIERYNIVALRTAHDHPHLSVIRGRHKIHKDSLRPGMEEFQVGDTGFDKRWQLIGDADFGRALLTPEVRAIMDDLDQSWVFQPGWVVRVTPWTFWSGEDKMLEELDNLARPLRAVPTETWAAYGGPPDFLGSLGHPPTSRS